MDNTFSEDVYAIENLIPVSPAAQTVLNKVQRLFYEELSGLALMYGVRLMGGAPILSTPPKVDPKPTHKWAVKMFQEGKKPGILGYDTAASYADAVSNLSRIASQYPVDYDGANRRYVGNGFFIAIEIKEIANEKNPANQTHQRRG